MIGAVLAVIVAVIVVLIAGGGKSNKSNASTGGGEIFLQPAAATGNNPFTPSVATQTPPPSTPSALPLPSATAAPSPSASAAQAVTSYSGSTPGLYGGTRQVSSCNKDQLVSFLQANPDKARAWAGVEGISVADIPSYVAGLTPAILRADTRVTNHGFDSGQATTYQAVLEAGTAVLVDNFGVPRARCYCGNPLTPPVPLTTTPTYTGQRWPAFQPTTIVVVVPAPQPQTKIIIVDSTTGTAFARPTGGSGATDTDAPPGSFATPLPAATPTPTPAPTPQVTPSAACSVDNTTWHIDQGYYKPTVEFHQQGTQITGTMTMPEGQWENAGWTGPTNSLQGTITGNRIDFLVTAVKTDGRVSKGSYQGTLQGGTVTDGTAKDLNAPDRGPISWTASGGPVVCASPSP